MGEMVGSKSLFPIVEGIVENPTSLVTYSVCSNGLFMTKKVCGRGTVTTKIDGIKGLPEGPKTDVKIDILPRKVPISYFWKIVEFFKYVANILPDKAEAYILLGYSFEKDDFILYVPKHEVTMASVDYDIEAFWKDNPGYFCILDAHLHPGFSAFWSGTDDKDDKRDRFSLVVGHQEQLIPEHKIRFSAGKKHIDLTLDHLFCNDEVNIKFSCEEAIKQINVNKSYGYADDWNLGYGGYSLYNSYKYKMKQGKVHGR